ncbi:unnamed protein product [[Candida] boidinii]|uniref:Unnamed protein product n=1 Tax=Candida boidinii TaxID=5477 RepID=A0A9W6T7U1_CANBO|nr:hypothetical protein B5S30_g1684 [[Candida] boidinii]OWB82672.1 hypothetical protein B5S33_g1300 [[Candida] boidinii]GME79065.1 unnamed protein product [[Candida] boidinii]
MSPSKGKNILSLLGKTNSVKKTDSKITKTPKANLSSYNNLNLDLRITRLIESKKFEYIKRNWTSGRSTNWSALGSHGLVYKPNKLNIENFKKGNNKEPGKKLKIASFDLDGTLIKTKSGLRFSRSSDDWTWFNDYVLTKIIELIKSDYLILIFTNQGGVVVKKGAKSVNNFTEKIEKIIDNINENIKKDESLEELPLLVYASTKKSKATKPSEDDVFGSPIELHTSFRKPNTGMWDEFLALIDPLEGGVDFEESFYVGDAAGRPKDFSDSDKNFAKNIGLKFHVPEDYFK